MAGKRIKREDHDLILQATDCLKLRDIFLFQTSMLRPNPFPKEKDARVVQQRKSSVKLSRLDSDDSGGEAPPLIQFFVVLGTRVIEPDPGSKNDKETVEYLEIVAEYLVEYEITDPQVSDEALQAFAKFNVIHNVWPFWRQHVFDLVKRGGLPRLEVPLFAGVKL